MRKLIDNFLCGKMLSHHFVWYGMSYTKCCYIYNNLNFGYLRRMCTKSICYVYCSTYNQIISVIAETNRPIKKVGMKATL